MKSPKWLITILALVAFILAGCGGPGTVDTTEMEQAFASASPEIKEQAQKVVDAVKAQKFKEALYPLDNLVTNDTLPQAQLEAAQKIAVAINQVIIARKGK